MNPIELAEDNCGRPIVRVKLAKASAEAALYLTDYEHVIAIIGRASWFLDTNGKGNRYVRALHPASACNVMIARLILGVDRGAVRYRDGDSLNLRSTNLIRPLRHRP
ncbi:MULTISPECIES: hypothetical protein [unclassified Bosea (in: a-proteobacteria)]|uniref:hypothetical protein n=1 Tax=unclassified Bosea (in: a-proteobacteria) TaxID=2653178 RepID=UPI000F74C1C4|nr:MULTISPECIES: hypothetical protein [unclassified Bosea (in: a-proteobacteria)]AZO77218.1 hypothetical protein BLM15_06045 [Bosea sp. Tri-49]RXT22069.1 hypothetical protein B5U98_16700 [Bosea sp. Tri-39]RXT32411.1 hypothetical protein B5U99_27545 [Bosea sp. Tri-54]